MLRQLRNITITNAVILLACLFIPVITGYDNNIDGNLMGFVSGIALLVLGLINFLVGIIAMLIAGVRSQSKNRANAFIVFGIASMALGFLLVVTHNVGGR